MAKKVPTNKIPDDTVAAIIGDDQMQLLSEFFDEYVVARKAKKAKEKTSIIERAAAFMATQAVGGGNSIPELVKGIRIAFNAVPLTAPLHSLMGRARTAAEIWKADHNFEVCTYAARLDELDKQRPSDMKWKDIRDEFESYLSRHLDHGEDDVGVVPPLSDGDSDSPAEDASDEAKEEHQKRKVVRSYINAWEDLSRDDVPDPADQQVPYAPPAAITRAQSHVFKRKTQALRRQYEKLAKEEAAGKMSYALRRERAKAMCEKECRAFANAMWNQYRVLVIMHVGRVGTAAEGNGVMLSAIEPDKRYTGFSAFNDYVDFENTKRADFEKCIDDEMIPYASLDPDDPAEPGRTQVDKQGKLVEVSTELERGPDGYPRIPADVLAWKSDHYPRFNFLDVKKLIIREFVRSIYRIGRGHPSRMPWQALSFEDTVQEMLAEDSLPETVGILVDPSHLKLAQCNELLSHWQARQAAGDIPFRFRMVLDSAGDLILAKKPTASVKKKARDAIRKGKAKATSQSDEESDAAAPEPPKPKAKKAKRKTGVAKVAASAGGSEALASGSGAGGSGASGSVAGGSGAGGAAVEDIDDPMTGIPSDDDEPDDAVLRPLRARPAAKARLPGLAQEDDTIGQPTPFGTQGPLRETYLTSKGRFALISTLNGLSSEDPNWRGLQQYLHHYGEQILTARILPAQCERAPVETHFAWWTRKSHLCPSDWHLKPDECFVPVEKWIKSSPWNDDNGDWVWTSLQVEHLLLFTGLLLRDVEYMNKLPPTAAAKQPSDAAWWFSSQLDPMRMTNFAAKTWAAVYDAMPIKYKSPPADHDEQEEEEDVHIHMMQVKREAMEVRLGLHSNAQASSSSSDAMDVDVNDVGESSGPVILLAGAAQVPPVPSGSKPKFIPTRKLPGASDGVSADEQFNMRDPVSNSQSRRVSRNARRIPASSDEEDAASLTSSARLVEKPPRTPTEEPAPANEPPAQGNDQQADPTPGGSKPTAGSSRPDASQPADPTLGGSTPAAASSRPKTSKTKSKASATTSAPTAGPSTSDVPAPEGTLASNRPRRTVKGAGPRAPETVAEADQRRKDAEQDAPAPTAVKRKRR
ncbi:hypothetical protein EIP91_010790 [Steccherinum ochraceum]|uniref:Uncharacterized protein n=1 Tax=Steccherinum ochraceum TaxID=92696 RepID=A0A4R0RC66_9APHY|nr:hypothetical protein EIP91_010790 [Steccherinum ochraceum]